MLVSIRVGDGDDGWPIEDLIHDLEHLTHEDAARHYGRSKGCRYRAFTNETPDGRDAFAGMIATWDDCERHLREWDEATRPVAIVHWWEEARG